MNQRKIVLLKVAVWIGLLLPIAYLAYGIANNSLGANPLSEIEHFTGEWTMRLLLATLAVTPARRLTGWNWLIRFRRLIGLFAFFYASCHFFAYLWFDQNFAWSSIAPDLVKRRFILVGFSAWVLLVPLAVTSTTGWIRRLGGKRWQRLHRLIYFSAAAGVVHFIWLVKADLRRPLTYGAVLAVLLVYRLITWLVSRIRARRAMAPQQSARA